MDNALARLARVAEENHINMLNSGQSSLPPPSGGNPATSLFGSLNTSQPQQNASTTQAQTSSLFGNTSQPAQTSSLFGNNTSQPAQTSSLFGNTTSQPAQTSSLFGNTTSQPAQTSSLFGNTSQPAQTTSLFGNTTSQPGQGGMFGSNQNQAGNNQQQQQGSSLFGGNQNNQSSGGLFGSQPTNQQTTGGLFGSTNAQQPQPQQTKLFGSVGQSQAQQPQNSLFGGTSTQSKTSSLLFVLSHMRIAFGKALGPEKLTNDYVVAICQARPKISSLRCSHPQPASYFRVRLVNTLNSSRPYQAFGSSMSTSFAPQHASMIYMKTCRRPSKERTITY